MKALVWGLCGLLALLWSGLLAAAGTLAAGAALALNHAGGLQASVPPQPPVWLAPWVDAALWTTLRESALALLGAAQSVLPALGTLAGWLEPLLWVVWGLGLLALLGLGAVLHSLAGDWRRQAAARA